VGDASQLRRKTGVQFGNALHSSLNVVALDCHYNSHTLDTFREQSSKQWLLYIKSSRRYHAALSLRQVADSRGQESATLPADIAHRILDVRGAGIVTVEAGGALPGGIKTPPAIALSHSERVILPSWLASITSNIFAGAHLVPRSGV